MPRVEAINLTKRIALLDDGRTLPITKLFDGAGEETDDPIDAFTFVCGQDDVWIAESIDLFQHTATQ